MLTVIYLLNMSESGTFDIALLPIDTQRTLDSEIEENIRYCRIDFLRWLQERNLPEIPLYRTNTSYRELCRTSFGDPIVRVTV
jgi:hypothetical protein